MSLSDRSKTILIQMANDVFRRDLPFSGPCLATPGVQALGDVMEVIVKVRDYNEFTEANDPHREHDFGTLEHKGEKLFWKIDYYDKEMKYGSEAPEDTRVTTRVLTLLLASEY